ncbi:MAG: PKD domain-containing protein [Thermoplasmata archaeon]|nr:PKD domain-containing protein [Thermoplasmata archaeon]
MTGRSFAPRRRSDQPRIATALLAFGFVLSSLAVLPGGPVGRSAPTVGSERAGLSGAGTTPAAGVRAPVPLASPSAQNWFNLSGGYPPGIPGNRTFAALAYDPDLNGTLMFGGFNQTRFGPDGDTWLFANGTWTNLTANLTSSPSPRWASLMTWDPWDHEMVLFGGRTSYTTLGDTWVFTSGAWSLLTPTSSPSPRQSQFSVFSADPTLGAVYLDGGSCYACGTIDNDSWTFLGGTWQNDTGTVGGGPAVLDYGTWDPSTNDILGYSSTATNCTGTSSTVAFNGSAWTTLNTTSAPGPVPQGGGLVYDALDSEVVLFGGGYDVAGICAFLNNTWSYANGTWTNQTANLTASPAARCCESVAYDPTQKVVVLLGGAETSQAYIGDTWTFPAAPLALTINRSTPIGVMGTEVNFSANVSGGVGPLTLNWSFGDGSANATGALVHHTFTSLGSFRVNFTVRDSQGRSLNRSAVLRVVGPLVAGVRATPLLGEAPLWVNFSANASGGAAPFVYSWTFGDGGLGSGASVTHLYRTPGNFSATVTVRDGSRQAERAAVNVSVVAPFTISLRTVPGTSTGDAPFLVNFTATPTGTTGPYTADWGFGDGSPFEPGLNVSHLYTAPGTFEAEVAVTDAVGHVVNGSVVVQVGGPLSVSASALRPAGLAPFPADFLASAGNGTAPYAFTWSFGDGSPNGTGAAPSHLYLDPGRYVAVLTTTDDGGGRVVTDVPVEVVSGLIASVSSNTTYGTAPLWVAFDSTVGGGLPADSFSWSFGDGGSSTTANATHRYATLGAFVVNYSVSDALGEVVHRNLTVDVYAPLRVGLSATPASLDIGGNATLSAVSTGGSGSVRYAWGALPPGCGTPTSAVVTCQVTRPGTFNVTVSVEDSRNDSATASVELTVVTPTPTNSGSGGSTNPAVTFGELIGAVAIGGLIGAVAVFLGLRSRRLPPPDSTAGPAESGAGLEGPTDVDRTAHNPGSPINPGPTN